MDKNHTLFKNQMEIGQSIFAQKKIYLDTNYWLRITDCKTQKDILLLECLSELVESKKIILPISEITFWEVLKQTDITSLKRSSIIIDKLSKGISIISERDRQKLEFIQFVRSNVGREEYNLHELVWTKLSLIIIYPIFLKNEPEMLEEDFINFLGNISFENILAQLEATSNLKPFYHKDNIDELNYNKEKYKNQNKNFDEMYLSELGGFLEIFKQDLNNYFEEFYFEETGIKPSEEEKQKVNSESWKNMIYNLSKRKKFYNELPSFRIFPEMNAVARWNKNRKYKDGNDTFDFLHVSAALPYFDYFFTERELRTVIKQRKMDEIYNCKVFSDIDEIIDVLKKNGI